MYEQDYIIRMNNEVIRTDVLLLDEPTSALDVMSKEKVMDYLQDIKQDKIIIIISHDCEIAELCDKVVKI